MSLDQVRFGKQSEPSSSTRSPSLRTPSARRPTNCVQELAEARSVSARQEHILTPTAENEVSAIVSHRMFASVDHGAAEQVGEDYVRYFTKMIEQGADLPPRATRSEYHDEIVQDYPFHPELLTTLNRKTSTIPNFQKTRGVLRLLAQTIRDLWQSTPEGLLPDRPATI